MLLSRPIYFSASDQTPPVGAWCHGVKLFDAIKKDSTWSVSGHDCEAALETGARGFPLLAAIGGECFGKGVAQRQALAFSLSLAAEQFEDALRLRPILDRSRGSRPDQLTELLTELDQWWDDFDRKIDTARSAVSSRSVWHRSCE